MRRRRHLVVALLAILAGPGCRAMTLNPGRPPVVPAVPTVAVDTLVERHNQNARKVRSLEARPSVQVSRRLTNIGAGAGRMALVRPRYFNFTVDKPAGGGTIAHVGSNDREFWIWSADSPEKEMYVGTYDAAGQPPPGLLVQPEWVTEALGLRLLTPEEVDGMTAENGTDADTITLVHTRPNGLGETTIKKTLVDRTQGLVREHIFYAADGETVLAHAWPSNYKSIQTGDGESVFLPGEIRIRATPPGEDPMDLRITMGLSDVKVNQFDETRLGIFEIPRYEGYAIRQIEPPATANTSRFDYETLPAPPARSSASDGVQPAGGPGVELRAPVPLGAGGQRLEAGDPLPRLADDLAPGGIDAIVRQPIPRPPTY